MITSMFRAAAQSSPLLDAPITTGAIFIALTGAIAYLYRARDRDHDSEVSRLERRIEQLERQLDAAQQERETEL